MVLCRCPISPGLRVSQQGPVDRLADLRILACVVLLRGYAQCLLLLLREEGLGHSFEAERGVWRGFVERTLLQPSADNWVHGTVAFACYAAPLLLQGGQATSTELFVDNSVIKPRVGIGHGRGAVLNSMTWLGSLAIPYSAPLATRSGAPQLAHLSQRPPSHLA